MSVELVSPQSTDSAAASLRCGDPGKGAATFTRFLLPFAYQPSRRGGIEPLASSPSTPYWREALAGDSLHATKVDAADLGGFLDRSRNRYLTIETASVLFERAKWLTLADELEPDKAWRTIQFKSGVAKDMGDVAVKLRPPTLILFEWPDGKQTGCCTEADELHTGLLIIEACFENEISFGSLLRFNELFRYWRQPFAEHPGYNPEMAIISKAVLGNESFEKETGEEQLYTARWRKLLELPLVCSNCVCNLMPEHCLPPPNRHFAPSWRIHADDRAFVATCAIVAEKQEFGDKVEELLPPLGLPLQKLREWGDSGKMPDGIGYWLRLLNVDNSWHSASLADLAKCTPFEREWLLLRTYRRWLHYGAAYGYTSHSAAMLSSPCDEPPTCWHFRQMYFDQLLLGLYMRSSLFRFSQSLSRISQELRDRSPEPDLAKFQEQFQRLRMQFDIFTNLYQFPLLSNQQQGVEMYQLMRTHLDIQAIYDEVHAEIDGTDEVIELQSAQQLNRLAALLGILGFVGVIASVVQAVMTLWSDGNADWTNRTLFWLFTLAISIAGLIGAANCQQKWLRYFITWFNRKNRGGCQFPRP